MRDNFYHWFVVALLFAMFFGAEVARSEFKQPDWFLIVAYGAIGIMSAAGAVRGFVRAKAGEDA